MNRNLMRRRLARQRKVEKGSRSDACCLFSVGGRLIGLRDPIPDGVTRSEKYIPVTIGKPLLCRYMGFFLNHPGADREEIMISSFLKSDEEKNPSAESVNFYDPALNFSAGKRYVELTNADTYQHELIYYTPSYVGESLKLTVKAALLNNPSDTTELIQRGLESAGQIPFFLEYLPYLAMGSSYVDILGQVLDWLYRDEDAIERLSLALFYDDVDWPKLRSGRYVCIKDCTEAEAKTLTLRDGYKLYTSDGELYQNSSYFVVQVNAVRRDGLEQFQYHQGAAELLALTNRDSKTSISEFIDITSSALASYADAQVMEEMESIQDLTGDPQYASRYEAFFRKLSKSSRDLYRPLFEKYRG